MRPLNLRERAFVTAFHGMARGNGMKAAIIAGYSPKPPDLRMEQMADAFEQHIERLARPLNGRCPRSWIRDPKDPLGPSSSSSASTSNGYPVDSVGIQERHMNAFFD